MFKGNESVAMFMYNSSVAGTRAKSNTQNQRCAGRGSFQRGGPTMNKHGQGKKTNESADPKTRQKSMSLVIERFILTL